MEELNSAFQSMNDEFSGHQDEQDDANDIPDCPSSSVDVDRSVKDREEEAIVNEFFLAEDSAVPQDLTRVPVGAVLVVKSCW